MLGLLDTGATSIFIKRSALKNVTCDISPANIKVKGRYSTSQIKEIASFKIKLPDFCGSRSVIIKAYVEDTSIGRHDIVLGIRYIQEMSLIFDFKRREVTWEDISVPMRKIGDIKPDELAYIDPQDVEAPEIIQQATKRMERMITPNNYNSYNYKMMILKCIHLTKAQQDILLNLFAEYSTLFDGKLGKVPNFKVILELKQDSKPFCARA